MAVEKKVLKDEIATMVYLGEQALEEASCRAIEPHEDFGHEVSGEILPFAQLLMETYADKIRKVGKQVRWSFEGTGVNDKFTYKLILG